MLLAEKERKKEKKTIVTFHYNMALHGLCPQLRDIQPLIAPLRHTQCVCNVRRIVFWVIIVGESIERCLSSGKKCLWHACRYRSHFCYPTMNIGWTEGADLDDFWEKLSPPLCPRFLMYTAFVPKSEAFFSPQLGEKVS